MERGEISTEEGQFMLAFVSLVLPLSRLSCFTFSLGFSWNIKTAGPFRRESHCSKA